MSPAPTVYPARPYSRIHAAAERLIGDGEGAAHRLRSGRLAAVMLILGDLYALLVTPSLPDPHTAQLWTQGIGWASAFVVLLLPWHRMPAWTIAVAPVWAVLLVSAGLGAVSGTLNHYGALYALLFTFTGLRWSPGCTTRLAVGAHAGLAGAVIFGNQQEAVVQLTVTIVITAAVGELMSLAVAGQRRARTEVQLLHSSLGQLVAAETESEAARVTAVLAHQLLHADGVVVMLAREPGSPELVTRGGIGNPAGAPTEIDIGAEQSGAGIAARSGERLFEHDAASNPLLSQRFIAALGAVSILFIPVPDEDGTLGVIIVWWTRPRQALDGFDDQVVALLSTQAGQVLSRLRRVRTLDVEAATDPLTGVANRRAFDAALTRLAPGAAVVLFDLDGFKPVNDTHGHAAGDAVLQLFGETLVRCVRDGDLVARLGGDEFAVLLPSPDQAGVDATVHRLIRRWPEPHGVTFSSGSALLGPDDTTVAMLRRADENLYARKYARRALSRSPLLES